MKKTEIDAILCNNMILRAATRRMGQLYDDVVGPSGLRATQLGLLSSIDTMDRPTMSELAEFLAMDPSALGHTLQPLRRVGLVELVPDERDRRAKIIALTEAGEHKLKKGLKLWQRAHDGFETAFGPEKAAIFREALSLIASKDFSEKYIRSLRAN